MIAAFSTGLAVPVLPRLPRRARHRRLVRPDPARARRPRGRATPSTSCPGHVGDRIRVTYTLRNTSRIPKPWLEIHNPTSLPGRPARPGASRSAAGPSARGSSARPLTRRGHFRIEPLQIRTGDPFGFFESSASVGQRDQRDRLPAARADPAVAAARGEPRRQPRDARADAPGDAARDDRPAVGAGRRVQPDPLEVDRAPRRHPGQGVRPRADGRRLDRARPRASGPAAARATSRRSRSPFAPPPRSPTRRSSRTAPWA